ncbi:helix-turn-helix domain-containing protein [Dactylosporangium sp. CA-152071]|uniref:helix-turn-helix domain-containing protein n=1 Tax=Dactylosporangium sp. CA-152071 TaxID=3239933 RepID=UPI003D8A72B3
MTVFDDQVRVRAERARQVALFRYRLIQDVIDVRLTSRERGVLATVIADREHDGPFGEKITVSRPTIDRWCRWWRRDGFAGLVPQPAQVRPRTPAEVLDMAAGLKRENLARTATQIARILRASTGWSPSERTLQRHFERLELYAPAPSGPAQTEVFGRFEADRPWHA